MKLYWQIAKKKLILRQRLCCVRKSRECCIFENENSAELGYLFNYSYWNNGYCKEAVNALINVAFDYYGVNCIYASYIVGNNASKTILKKIGFDECGYQKDKITKNKISFDVVNLKLLKNK